MNTPDRPNILWLSLEDTTPRFGCYCVYRKVIVPRAKAWGLLRVLTSLPVYR